MDMNTKMMVSHAPVMVALLRRHDWCHRHVIFRRMQNKYGMKLCMERVEMLMASDELLTGTNGPRVLASSSPAIALPDRPSQRSLYDYGFVPMCAKKTKLRQLKMEDFFEKRRRM